MVANALPADPLEIATKGHVSCVAAVSHGGGGYIQIRADNHQGYEDAVTGFSKNVPEYPFPIWDPARIITIPIRQITAPSNWPKPGTTHNDVTSAYNWIKTTWPQMKG